MRYVVMAIAAVSLAACGSEETSTFVTEDGESGEISVDRNDGAVRATIETEDGTATMETGENVKADLPDGFTIYPGAKVISATNITQEADKGSLVMLESDDSPEEIAAHYRKQAEAAGIEIQMDMTVNGGKMLAGEGSDGKTFSVNANAEEGKTTAQLMVSEGLGN